MAPPSRPGSAWRARRLAPLLFIALWIALHPQAAPESHAASGRDLLMWRVTLPDTPGAAYLLGSIHIVDSSIFPLHPTIEAAYRAADVVVVEAVIDETAQLAGLMHMGQLAMLPPDKDLQALLSPRAWRALQQRLGGGEGLGVELVRGLKPMMVAFMLVGTELSQTLPQATEGIDMHFITQARRDAKPLEELESVAWQLQMIGDIPLPLQAKYLETILEKPNAVTEEYHALARLWRAGDAEGLAEHITAARREDPGMDAFYEILLDARNPAMAERILAMLRQDREAFVIIGAAHYVGEDGVLELLEHAGARVEQVRQGDAVQY